MARTALAAQTADPDGLISPVFSAANVDGHWVDPGDLLIVRNTNGATRTVTVVSGATFGSLAVADVAVVVPATTGEAIIGGLRADVFAQPSGAQAGKVYIDFSAVTGVTVAAIRQ
jgi:hypothetical protein